ncbi:MAG: hypothetical protein LAP87_09820 [Acidobacteriia bacterium]|nr:hypothetical protein [Terriglobia bacterium]
MKKLIALALVVFPALALDHDDDRDWRHEEQETIRRSFNVSAGSGAKKLLVDNFSGYVHVTGASGAEVQVTIQKHIRAESTEAVAEAKRDVKLDISQQGNSVRLYVDGPSRSSHGNNYRGDRYYGYRVQFDYDIQVPPDTELVLKTFNRGNIEVKGTSGDFEVHNFNGGIDLQEMGGSGSVNTFNGPVKVAFTRNPAHEATFKTFNGSIDVYLQPGLDADLQFKTFHGGVYSDFDVTTLPSVVSGEIQSGRFVYRSSDHATKVRAGKGGPAMSFDTFNGSIRLHSKGQ